MKTDLDDKLLFFVLGAPRSGTTIVSTLFNSLEDGFCLGEPHWYLQSGHGGDGSYGKCKPYYREVNNPKLIMQTNIIPILERDEFHVGGYKETWHKGNREEMTWLIESHLSFIDFCVIVFRDPVLTLSSLRAHQWLNLQPGAVNRDYDYLDKLAQHPKGIAVVLEEYCKDPLGYMNARLPFQIEGELRFEPSGHSYGDPRANKGTGIKIHKRDILIPHDWVNQLEPARRIWERWRKHG